MTVKRNRVSRWYNVLCNGELQRQTKRVCVARRVARHLRQHTSEPIVITVREAAMTYDLPPNGHYSFTHRSYRSGLVKAWEVLPDGRLRRLPVRRSTRGGKPDNHELERAGNVIIDAAGFKHT